MKRITPSIVAVFSLFVISGTAFAGSDSGFYVGGSVGSAQIDYSDDDPDFDNVDDIDFDDDDTGYKIFAGYNFGIIPLIDLAVEGAYVDFGEFSGDVDLVDSKLEVDGWTGAALGGVNLGPIGLFAKVGFIDWDGEFDLDTFGDTDEDGTDPLYGVGAKFQIASFQVRAEWERFDLDKFDIDYFSLGGAFVF